MVWRQYNPRVISKHMKPVQQIQYRISCNAATKSGLCPEEVFFILKITHGFSFKPANISNSLQETESIPCFFDDNRAYWITPDMELHSILCPQNELRHGSVLSLDNIWAVTRNSDVSHWNGREWELYPVYMFSGDLRGHFFGMTGDTSGRLWLSLGRDFLWRYTPPDEAVNVNSNPLPVEFSSSKPSKSLQSLDHHRVHPAGGVASD